ncbi:MAG: M14 family zinc carboxypeptidase [Caldimonas sp.]
MRVVQGGRVEQIGKVVVSGTVVMVIAACASSPLPPWPAGRSIGVDPSVSTGSSRAPVAAPSPTSPASASTTAVATPVRPAATPPVASLSSPLPVSPVSPITPPGQVHDAPLPLAPPVPAAIAAHFPVPAVTFATPAFEPGREAFTRSDELHSILYGLERDGASASARTDVKVLDLGLSQSGQPIEALAFTRLPPPAAPAIAAEPAVAGSVPPVVTQPLRRPAVVVVAGQHGDEPAGTEALIVVAQDLAAGRLDAVLDRVDVVLLPRANPDGAALFQRGAADGSDINRDHLLLVTPEAQAQTRLLVDFEPVVVLDLHEYPVGGAFTTKFGAVQRFDALLQYATTANLPPFVTRAAEEWFRLPLIASLRGAGLIADWYATTSLDPNDRRLSMGGVGPQIGRNATGLRNAVSLLVETRGGGLGRGDLKRRVQAQVVAVNSVLSNAALRAADLVKLRQFVDRDVAAKACHGDVVLEAVPTSSEYALSVIDAATGAIRRINVAWDSALALRPLKTRPRPCGYWLAASETDAVRRLRLLGVEVSQLDEGAELRGETYREIARQPVGTDAAGHAGATTRVIVQTMPALLDIAAGGYYVSLAQPLANLALAALEPEDPASFAANRVIGSVATEARILQRAEPRMTSVP